MAIKARLQGDERDKRSSMEENAIQVEKVVGHGAPD